jgi:glucose/arabinose dehydrogenase
MRALLLGAALALLAAAPASAAPELVKLGDFADPLYVTSPPDDTRVFVVEKQGLIKIVGGGTFLDAVALTDSAAYERGLLSMAFHPGYAANGLFYIFVTAQGGGDLRVYEVRRSATDPNRADAASARPILTIEHSSRDNHNGGQLQFGPDGMLYVSTGDGAENSGTAEQTSNELGKILRIDPATGAAAAGNPFGNRVWSYGLRNPWRFSFDRATGDMIIGDVGSGSWEEIDWAPAPARGAGLNFGWDNCEGPDPTHSCGEHPVVSMDHGGDDAFLAIVGGYVVRDAGLPTLNGRYLYGDNHDTSLWSAVPRTGAGNREEALRVDGLTSFGEDSCGRIYVASMGSDAVYRLQDGAPSTCAAAGPPPADAAAPNVRVRVRGVKKRRLRVALTCDEACRVTVNSRLRRVRKLKARHRDLAANRRAIVRVKLSRKVTRRMRRALASRGYVRVVVRVRAVDGAGNARVVTKRGRIKR